MFGVEVFVHSIQDIKVKDEVTWDIFNPRTTNEEEMYTLNSLLTHELKNFLVTISF